MTELTREDVVELMRAERFVMLTTVGKDSSLYSHPMTPREVTDEAAVYFLLADDSEQAAWLKNDPNANLSFADSGTWLSVAGQVTFLTGQERDTKAEQFWSERSEEYFDGKDDPRLAVIRFEPESAQFWGDKSGTLSSLVNLATFAVTGEQQGGTAKTEL